MERSEAVLYLPLTEDDSLEDLYEQKLFEWKNFFVHRFPIPKLFKKKLVQLERLEQAYVILGGKHETTSNDPMRAVAYVSDLKQSFQEYHNDRNSLKKSLYAATTAPQIITTVQRLVEITRAYAEQWYDPALNVDGVIVSKESDPMDLLNAIKDAQSMGVDTIANIGNLSGGHMVLNEAKRLSLWIKMDGNE